MANTVQVKRSGTANSTPSALEYGELALNYADNKVFWKNASNTISSFTFQSYVTSSSVSSFGSTLIASADAATARTTLGTLASADPSATGSLVLKKYASAPGMLFDRANGTESSPSSVTAISALGDFVGRGYDGATYRICASIGVRSAGAVTSTDCGGFLVLNTVPAGSTTQAERVRIGSDGKVGIGTTSATALLDVNSDTLRLRTARTPASATAAGNAGDICWDASYLYICTATGTWRRIAHSTW